MGSGSLGELKSLGASLEEKGVSGSYLLRNSEVSLILKSYLERKGVLFLDIREAKSRFNWLSRYVWKVLSADMDEYTKLASEEVEGGILLYVPKGAKVSLPLQACFLISKPRWEQVVHNVVIVGENAEVTLNTFCASTSKSALHVGVTEIYVGRGARVNYVMVHGWREGVEARPRTGVNVDKGGSISMYYINLKPVSLIEMSPLIRLRRESSASLTSILMGLGSSRLEVGSRVELVGERARANVISRSIAKDEARVKMLGKLTSESRGSRGHLECKGLQLSPRAVIEAVPVLVSRNEESELTHEASIGRLSEEALYYLMSKGFTEEEAISMLVRGFIDVGLEDMPHTIKTQISIILNLIAKYGSG